MRRLTFAIAPLMLAAAAGAAQAEPQSYCEVYSKDFADIRTSNVDQWQLIYRSAFNDCMASYNAKPSAETVANPVAAAEAPVDTTAVEPEATTEAAVAPEQIVGPEDPGVMAKKAKTKQVAARAKSKPRKVTVKPAPAKARVASKALVPGSDEWNSYCAAKYSSFNALSGTYMSNSGKIRRCR